ncbi:MAG TPA: ScyD/ScyE family protein, partial [Blastocatellia bacterium]|nr:ScyD/ScyE family protein [Blastocatellia bacterium]
MRRKLSLFATIAVLSLMLGSINVRAQTATTSVFASGLRAPVKIIVSPRGNLLVAEEGNGPNTGRVSILDLNGNHRTLIDGLPSGFTPPNNDPSGPSGLAMRGRTLYVVIGNGDATLNGPVPATEIPNPNPSSPFLSSVLSIRLGPRAEETTQGFTMTLADQLALQSRGFLSLSDTAGNDLLIEVVTNFPNFTFEPRPNFGGNVRPSNPFGIVIRGRTLYVVDAAQNQIYEVDSDTGETSVLIRFPS